MQNNDSCLIMIKHLQNTLEKQLNWKLTRMDITMTQAAALAAILEHPDGQLTLKELEKSLHLAQSVTAGIVTRLEQKRFLESFGDPADKRIKIVKITPQGTRACQAAQKIMLETEKRLSNSFTTEEYETFRTFLQKAAEALSL